MVKQLKPPPENKQHPAYHQGYRAGVRRSKNRSDAVIAALRERAEYWRRLYIELRDGKLPR